MTNKIIYRIYTAVLILFVFILALLIIVPYGFAPQLIEPIWGLDTPLHQAIINSLINLTYGIISNTVLALLISFIASQYEATNQIKDFVKNINSILSAGRYAINRQEVGRLSMALDTYKREKSQSSKASSEYLAKCIICFPRKKHVIVQKISAIDDAIVQIDEKIEIIQEKDQRVSILKNNCLSNYGQSLNRKNKSSKNNMKDDIEEIDTLSRQKLSCLQEIERPVQNLETDIFELNRLIFSNKKGDNLT